MAGLPLTALIVCLFMSAGESQGFTIQTNHRRITATVGGDAFFNVTPSAAITGGSWEFNGTNIIQWVGTALSFNNAYKPRIELFTTNGSLLLKLVKVSDSGEYRVEMNPKSGSVAQLVIALRVLEPVSNVTVTSNNTNPVENNDTIVLTCDAQGTVQRRTWFKNNLLIQENERILTSSGNTTLTITRVNRTDTGIYKCEVSNDHNSKSAEIHVQVNYGPDNVKIKQKPSVPEIGSSLTLTCSALSVPNGEYEWYNGTTRLQKGPNYSIQSVSSVHSGNYTCRVNNSITMKSSQLTIEVTVENKAANVSQDLKPGAIAGIVIAVIAFVAIGAGSVAFVVKKNFSRFKAGSSPNDIKMASPENIQTQTEYAEIERKHPGQPRPVQSSNGANPATSQAKGGDVIYTSPNIVNPAAKATTEPVIDSKTDYAELKYR